MDFDLVAGPALLERTPPTLRAMLAGLAPVWTDATEGPDTWSPYVIVGHLIHGERTDWIPRAEIILAQGQNRRFTPYDRFAQFHESQGKSLGELLEEFARLRAENLATLAGWHLSGAQLALEGEHPACGLGHVAKVMCHPGGQQLAQRDRSERGMLASTGARLVGGLLTHFQSQHAGEGYGYGGYNYYAYGGNPKLTRQ